MALIDLCEVCGHDMPLDQLIFTSFTCQHVCPVCNADLIDRLIVAIGDESRIRQVLNQWRKENGSS